jgi:hypothetical protein
MMAKHEEAAWIPICVPLKGRPWFFWRGVRDLRRDARDAFAEHCNMDWKELHKEGWRIIRVKITNELHG